MKHISQSVIGFALAALLISCGGEDDSGATPSQGNATFSGAVTGSQSGVIIAIDSDQSASVKTTVDFSGSTGGITFGQEISLSGYTLATGTYTSSNTDSANGSITFNSTNYGEVGGSTASTEEVGSFTLTITDAGSSVTQQGVTLYLGVHGTLTASYALNTTAGGTAANVSVTF